MANARVSLEDQLALLCRLRLAHRRMDLRLRQWAHHDHDAQTLQDLDEAERAAQALCEMIKGHYERWGK